MILPLKFTFEIILVTYCKASVNLKRKNLIIKSSKSLFAFKSTLKSSCSCESEGHGVKQNSFP